jgi:hypothetical protein
MAEQACNVIKQGGSSVTIYDLGVGTSFNVSNIRGYQNFTLNNFVYRITSNPLHGLVQGYKESSGAGTQGVQGEYRITFSYNNSTGIFTNSSWQRTEMTSTNGQIGVHAYLIINPSKVPTPKQ